MISAWRCSTAHTDSSCPTCSDSCAFRSASTALSRRPSRFSPQCSIARRTVIRTGSSDAFGLGRNANAPSSIAVAACSNVSNPELMIHTTSGTCSRPHSISAIPSIPGITMSVITTSMSCSRSSACASRPSSASSTVGA